MMTLLSMQDGLATLIALGAGAILLRRVLGFARSSSESPCAHCSSSPTRKPAPGDQATGGKAPVFPLTLVRPADGPARAEPRAAVPGTRVGARS